MPNSITWAGTQEKIAWVRDAAGPRFDELVFNVYPSTWPITVGDDVRAIARQVQDSIRQRTGVELPEQDVIDSPHSGLPAGRDKDNPPAVAKTEPYKTHLAYVKERRTEEEAEALLDDALKQLKERRGES